MNTNTENNLFDKRTWGKWLTIADFNKKEGGSHPHTLIVSNHKQVANCFNRKEENNISIEEAEANAAFIVHACNNFEKLIETLDGIGSLLEFAINATPTGAVRNLLCDANILAKAAIQKASQ